MNHPHESQELDDVLGRAGDYLMRRTAEYRETPVVMNVRPISTRRGKRLLVGTAAAATLCVTALAGSFIGGTSSGKVDVAKAAWSAIPSAPTDDLIKQTKNNCHITNETLAGYEGATVATFPQDMLDPALIDVRGTTTTAVYFTPSHAVLCVQFADGSVSVNDMPMGPNDGNDGNGWKTPGTITVKIDGNDGTESFMATMIVGYLPDGENWDPYIKVDGIETVAATKSERWGRYIAWIPGEVSGLVAMVNKLTDEGFDLPFGPEEEAPVQLSPETTIETKVSDQGVVTPLGDPATTVSPGD
ncbi:MAG: hypothetical protein B7C54_09760 [Acidimicrobiales bacterium mtb01]|nr:hypothetical protein [Actinomycetota bacterium]TEX45370.1 MAG: hypothetical protein B7C54_09760 [Acidimicrobiales bacterium mtb01]